MSRVDIKRIADTIGGVIDSIRGRARGPVDEPPRNCPVELWNGEEIPDGELRCDGRTHLRGPGQGVFAGLCSPVDWDAARDRVAKEELRMAAQLDKIARINGEGTGFEHFHPGENRLLQRALESAKAFAGSCVKDGRAPRRSIMFGGPTGCGKTHLLTRIHLSVLAAGFRSEFVTSADFRVLARDEARREPGGRAAPEMARLYRADVVCFDEFGHIDGDQRPRGTFAEALLRLLDGMKGVIAGTTNCSVDEMLAHSDLGSKVVSRLLADCRMVGMGKDAADFRLKSADMGRK